MATFSVVFEESFNRDVRRRVDEGDGWLPLHTMRAALSYMLPPAPPRLHLRAAPRFWVSSRDFAAAKPELFFKLTSFTVTDFDAVLDLVDAYIRAPRRTLGVEVAQHFRRGRQVAADSHHCLFLAVCKLRTGASFATQLSSFCPWRSESSLHDNFWHVLGAIEQGMGHLVQWPDADRRAELSDVMPGLKGCIGMVDATELFVPAPTLSDDRRERYSGKKKRFTVMIQVVVDAYGNIIHIGGGTGGRRNNINLWKLTEVGKAASRHQGRGWFDALQYLIADCGYGGCSRILMPYRDSEMSATTATGRARRIFSNLLRRYRAANEYIFGIIKGRYRMLGGVITCHAHRIPLLFKAAALLVQFSLQKAPIRDSDFYTREELRVSDWEGRCFSNDEAFAPSLVSRFRRLLDPQPPTTHTDHLIAHELSTRIVVAGSSPDQLAHTLANTAPPS